MDSFTEISKDKSLVLFDGVCNLCNSSVQFIIKRDPKAHFIFASLQDFEFSAIAKQLNIGEISLESIVLLENNHLYKRSTAALRIARKLSGLWPMLYVFIIIPPFIRDIIYNWIAHNRYRWFGRRDQCMIPDKSLQARFL